MTYLNINLKLEELTEAVLNSEHEHAHEVAGHYRL